MRSDHGAMKVCQLTDICATLVVHCTTNFTFDLRSCKFEPSILDLTIKIDRWINWPIVDRSEFFPFASSQKTTQLPGVYFIACGSIVTIEAILNRMSSQWLLDKHYKCSVQKRQIKKKTIKYVTVLWVELDMSARFMNPSLPFIYNKCSWIIWELSVRQALRINLRKIGENGLEWYRCSQSFRGRWRKGFHWWEFQLVRSLTDCWEHFVWPSYYHGLCQFYPVWPGSRRFWCATIVVDIQATSR